MSNGTKFNGYAAGTITTLVDLIPYIESVTNLTETAGGDDGEPYTTEATTASASGSVWRPPRDPPRALNRLTSTG